MGYKRVANFFLNKEKDATGNRPGWKGSITLDKDVKAGENILISVGNSETHTLQVFPSSRLPIFDYLQNVDRYDFFLATPKRGAKTSRQVYVRDSQTGEEINTDLRVRLTTNNGIGAWLGGKDWSSNTSASLSFKVQQDNVGALLDNVAEYSEIVNYGDQNEHY